MSHGLASLEGLVRLSNNEGVDIRRPLLRVLTDLYVQEQSHSREEEQQYVELALRLLPAVDVATKTAVARKLAVYALTPLPVIEALAKDAPEVAVLVQDAVALRSNGGSGDASQNAPAPAASDVPHEPLRRRDALAPESIERGHSAGEMFLQAGSEERVAWLERMDESESAASASPLKLPARAGAAARMERAAMQRNRHEFARELQLSLGISGRTAWRMVQDDLGEPLVVAAKALEIPSDAFVRIILFINPRIGESVERVFSLTRLYEYLRPAAVAPIVASWREEAAARPAARLAPLHAPDLPAAAASARENARTPREVAAEPVRRIPADTRLRGQGGA